MYPQDYHYLRTEQAVSSLRSTFKKQRRLDLHLIWQIDWGAKLGLSCNSPFRVQSHSLSVISLDFLEFRVAIQWGRGPARVHVWSPCNVLHQATSGAVRVTFTKPPAVHQERVSSSDKAWLCLTYFCCTTGFIQAVVFVQKFKQMTVKFRCRTSSNLQTSLLPTTVQLHVLADVSCPSCGMI